jgi:hypothetical protein
LRIQKDQSGGRDYRESTEMDNKNLTEKDFKTIPYTKPVPGLHSLIFEDDEPVELQQQRRTRLWEK